MNSGVHSTYRKITSTDQLRDINARDILIKYPALGLPENTIDLSDDTRFLTYEVYKIENNEILLQIPASEIAPSLQNKEIPHMNGRSDEPSVLVKDINVLIKENLWWIRS